MIRTLLTLFSVSLLSFTGLMPRYLYAEDITVAIEELPLKAEAAELIHAIFREAGIKNYQIQQYPWARAYRMALSQKNVLIPTMSRTEEREPLFQWVGQFLPLNYYFVKKKSNTSIHIETLDDAKYQSISLINQHVVHKFFQQRGFTNLRAVSDYTQVFQMLAKDRVKMIPISNVGFTGLCEKRQDCDQYESIFKIDELSKGLFFAYSQQTSNDIVAKTSKALSSLKASGAYDRIMKRWIRLNNNASSDK